MLPPKQLEYAIWLVLSTGSVALSGLVLLVLGYVLRSPTLGWTGVRVFLIFLIVLIFYLFNLFFYFFIIYFIFILVLWSRAAFVCS